MGLSRRKAIVLSVAAAGVPLLAACAQQAQRPAPRSEAEVQLTGPVEVQLWHVINENTPVGRAFVKLINDFNAAKPNIKVKADYKGNYTELFRAVRAAVAAGATPDLAPSYESFIPEYMRANAVVALDDYVRVDKVDLNDFFPGMLESLRFKAYDNKLLQFPFTKSMLVMHYNEDMLKEAGFNKPPETWDEFLAMAPKLTRDKDGDGKPDQFAYRGYVDLSRFDGMIYTRGGKLLSDDQTRVLFMEKPGVDSIEWIANMQPYAFLPPPRSTSDAEFAAGNFAIMLESSTGLGYIPPLVGDKFKWGTALIPQLSTTSPKATVLWGGNINIFKSTPERQRGAWEFIKWFTDRDQTAWWATQSGYLPVRKSAAETQVLKEFWAKEPRNKVPFDLLPYGKGEPNVDGWQEIRDVMQELFDYILSGQFRRDNKAPRQALQEATDKCNKILAEKRGA